MIDGLVIYVISGILENPSDNPIFTFQIPRQSLLSPREVT